MNMRDIDRLKVIQAIVDVNLTASIAANRLQLTKRQVNRLVLRYRADGAAGLIARQRGQPGQRHLADGMADIALAIIRDRYPDFGPTLASEKLRERHGIALAKETVRTLMTDAGLWIPRKQRPPSIYQPRNRRSCVGELIQIDGSDHRWFEDRAPACTLLVYIDDATSRLVYLHFTFSESTFSYFEATRAYLERYGKPQAFYSDKAGVFRDNHKQNDHGPGFTQFGRVLYELNIDIWCANTSQAKGRVERANLTLQDRLVKELRLEGISSMAAANAYVPAFMVDFNQRLAKPPRSDVDVHRPIRQDEDLDRIFTVRQLRKVSHVLTLQYDKAIYLLADTPFNRALIGKYIDVFDYPDGSIQIRADDTTLPYVRYDRLPQVDQGAIVENKRLGHALQVANLVQQQRDNRRSHSAPARTNLGGPVRKPKSDPQRKTQRQLDASDVEEAIRRCWR
ncbi:MAG: ISNCY family transposase [Noviherbaspirillum sp.]